MDDKEAIEKLREVWYSLEVAVEMMRPLYMGSDPEKAHWLVKPVCEKMASIFLELDKRHVNQKIA